MSNIKNAAIEVIAEPSQYPATSCPGLIIQKEFSNYTSKDLYTKLQGNIPVVIKTATMPRTSGIRGNHVEIKTTFTIMGQKAFVETRKILEALIENKEPMSPEAKWLYAAMVRLGQTDNRLMTRARFEFNHFAIVRETEIANHDRVYVQGSDIVFSYRPDMMARPHPNTEQGFNLALIQNNEAIQGYSGVFIQVIDNTREIKSLFYYAGRQIVEVPANVDAGLKSGVYVRIAGQTASGYSIRDEFYSFKEAEENIGLYRTQDEARTNGDPESLVKLEAIRLATEDRTRARELEELKHQHDREKHEYEMEKIAHAKELAALTQENKKLSDALELASQRRDYEFMVAKQNREVSHVEVKQENDFKKQYVDDYFDRKKKKRSDKYDKRSTGMKMLGDLVKVLPAIVLGIIGVVTLFRKSA